MPVGHGPLSALRGPADPWHGDLNLSDVEEMVRGHALEPAMSSLGSYTTL
jgi:hypothetical protein